ncbi:MAG TPA: T9SS type A sorting domain-containing protein [Chitinophagaceae bacterium]|nr:T9SS type A sorting domain-containing protein [Chitinophagaceae bacterium]
MRIFTPRYRKLAISVSYFTLLSILFNTAAAQCFVNPRIKKITADISWAIKSYMEYKPVDFDTNPTKKYALLIYFGGTGEMFQQPGGSDQDLCPVLGYSMPWRMNVGHFPNTVLDNAGQQWSYLVVMPFVTEWSQQYSVDPGAVIDYMLQHYAGRIDVSRIYLTGMSRGTDNLMGYVTSSASSARRVAAIVPVANCFPAMVGTPTYDEQVADLAAGNVHMWGIQCAGDVPCPESNMQNWVSSLNNANPGFGIFTFATFACSGPDNSNHYAWNHAYDPDYRPAATGNKNVYEWMIQFTQTVSLPIKLKDWNARLVNGKVMLEWITTEEFNTKEFIIQRSAAGGVFENIFTVPAAVASSTEKKYSLTDHNPLPGLSLYRLVLRDQDGKEEYYSIKRVLVRGGWTDNVIIPNPVNDGLLTVYLNIQKAQRVSVRVFDVQGRLLRHQDRQLQEGVTTHNVNVSTLQKGVYFVQVIGEDFKAARKVLIE